MNTTYGHGSRTRRHNLVKRAAIALVTIAVACGGGDATGPGGGGGGGGGSGAVASVVVTPSTTTVMAGATATLAASALDASGNSLPSATVVWTSADAGLATVSGGVVTGKAIGTVTITASSGGKSGTATITVTDPVASVTLAPVSKTITAGDTTTISATLRDAAGAVVTGRQVAWASSDTTIAKVSAAGLVTGEGAGTATITATSEGKSATAGITVTVPVASVLVAPASLTITYFDTTTITATPRSSNGTALPGRVVTWSSSDTTIAKVSAAGLVSAGGVGTATISATSEGQTGNAAITVTKAPVAQIVPNPTTMSLKPGASQAFTVALLDASGNKLFGRRIIIAINGSATVTQSGAQYMVTAGAAGTTTLTITAESAPAATVTVTVTP